MFVLQHGTTGGTFTTGTILGIEDIYRGWWDEWVFGRLKFGLGLVKKIFLLQVKGEWDCSHCGGSMALVRDKGRNAEY